MVKILVEYEKGEESAWFPWLNSWVHIVIIWYERSEHLLRYLEFYLVISWFQDISISFNTLLCKTYHLHNSLPRYYTNAASMTPFCCLCLPSLMRKLAVKERGNMQRLSVSSIKLIPFLNEDTKYDADLCEWVYQIGELVGVCYRLCTVVLNE